MKLIVFSDSHGDVSTMKKALEAHPDAECVLHAGDGARDFAALRDACPGRAYSGVCGNCDFFTEGSPPAIVLELAGKRILLTHGHRFRVKHTTETLIAFAEQKNADIVIFGHTHEPLDLWLPDRGARGIRLFNPGTVSGSGTGNRTYGIIDIRPNGVLCSVACV